MRKKNNKKNKSNLIKELIGIAVVIYVIVSGYIFANNSQNTKENSVNGNAETLQSISFDLSNIPEYSSKPYVEINDNKPNFTEEDYTTEAFERYSDWDEYGRTGVAFANICRETMPKKGEERGDISSVKNLSGWVQKRYDGIIKDKYLYNRCHLIGWQLSSENANKKNLMTGTRYLNVDGMLPFENMVAEYLKDNRRNHVLYRVTPIYQGTNKLASGVQMEAKSVEDDGICFNIYCYNVQPGIIINYATGESKVAE